MPGTAAPDAGIKTRQNGLRRHCEEPMSTDEKLGKEKTNGASSAGSRKSMSRRAVLKAAGAGIAGGAALYGMNALGLFPE
jgi:hypothetical protein